MAESTVTNEDLAQHLANLTKAVQKLSPTTTLTPATSNGHVDEEALFGRLKERLLADPDIVRITDSRPVLQIAVSTPTVEVSGDSVKGRVGLLIKRGFFGEPRTSSAVRTELRRTGPDVNNKSLSLALADFLRLGFVTLEGGAYVAVKSESKRLIEVEV